MPDLKDWSNFSRGKSGRPKMGGGRTAGEGVERGAAIPQEGNLPLASLRGPGWARRDVAAGSKDLSCQTVE